jgi:exonuclease III
MFTFTIVYTPNSKSDWFEHIEKYVDELSTSKNENVLMGDCNINENKNPDFKFLTKTFGLSQIIKEDTRVTQGSRTFIDHIYMSESLDICKSGVISIGM